MRDTIDTEQLTEAEKDEMKKQIKRERFRQFIADKQKAGWRNLHCITPPEVYSALLDFKNLKMAEWRFNNAKRLMK